MLAADLWKDPGCEPELSEMLSDPIVRAVMRRDGLSLLDVLEPALEARAALAEKTESPATRWMMAA